MKTIIYIILGFIGFSIVLFAAGSSDADLIDISHIITRCSIGLFLMAMSCFGLHLEERRRENNFLEEDK